MLKMLKNKVLPMMLAGLLIFGNLQLSANARAWNFDNNDEEYVSLQNPAIPNGTRLFRFHLETPMFNKFFVCSLTERV